MSALAHQYPMSFAAVQKHVAVLERATDVGFGTSKANSGIIHGGHQSAPGTLKGSLEWLGNQMWGDLCDELGFGFARVGALTVALTAGTSLEHA